MTSGTGGQTEPRPGQDHVLDVAAVEGVNEHETQYLYEDIFTHRSYLPEGTVLPHDATVLDVGANIGMFALFVKSVCPSARVYAFEPLPPVHERLTRNLLKHAVSGKAFRYGLSDRDGDAEFVYYPGYSIMSAERRHAAARLDMAFVRNLVLHDRADELGDALDFLDEMLEYRFREETYPCPVRRLSTVVQKLGLSRIDLLKIDVQRAEADVLCGIDDQHWPLIRRIALEVHDERGSATEGRLSTVLATLRSRGYQAQVMPAARPGPSSRHTVFATAPESD